MTHSEINKKLGIKMESLELKRLKEKKLTVFIVEKEYNEPFCIIDQNNHFV